MQLLIDVSQETPDSLLLASEILKMLSEAMVPVVLGTIEKPTPQPASINGPAVPIVLHAREPAAPIDPVQMNPADVFGQFKPFDVPAGTPDAYLAGITAPLAPPAPTAPNTTNVVPLVALPATVALAPPAPMTTQPNASDAMTTVGIIGSLPVTPVVAPPLDTAVTTVPASAVVSTDRDKDGTPWDARVHSETRKTNADGTWRYRRNLDANVKAAVTAELKALHGGQTTLTIMPVALAAPTPEQIAIALGVAPTPPSVTLPQPGPGLLQPAAPLPLPAGVSVGLPNAPQSPVVSTAPVTGFRDFMSKVNKALAAGLLKQEQLTAACRAVNLDSVSALAAQPMLVGLVDAQINQLLGAATA